MDGNIEGLYLKLASVIKLNILLCTLVSECLACLSVMAVMSVSMQNCLSVQPQNHATIQVP